MVDQHRSDCHDQVSPPRRGRGRVPDGFRVLHVLIPAETFNHLKAQACLTGTRFPEFVVRQLQGVAARLSDAAGQILLDSTEPLPPQVARITAHHHDDDVGRR